MRQVGVALKNITEPCRGGGEKSGKYYRDKTEILRARAPTPLPGDK